jgi:hypothetical protein
VAVDPLPQTVGELRLLEEEMLAVADLDLGRTGQRRARGDQVRRIEDAGAVFALVAARPLVTAMRAGADHVAVRQEAAIRAGVDLPGGTDLQMAVPPQRPRKILGELPVLRAR